MKIKIPNLPQAVCAQVGGELFFYDLDSPEPTHVRMAKKVCAGCPEKQACLDFAIENNEEHGIWGGMTVKERRRYRRRMRYVQSIERAGRDR